MDRPIDSKTRIRRIARRILIPVAVLGLAALGFAALTGWIRPSVQRSRIRTARVDRGPMEAVISASGTVVPEYEHVITSPIESRVTRILLAPGAPVEAGEPIVLLDAGETKAAVEKLDDLIALRGNEREQAILEQARQKSDLDTRRRIQELELKSREYDVERNRRLGEAGLVSQDEMLKAETAAEKARIELRQIDESADNLARALERKLRGLDLEIAIHRKDRDEAARQLERATAASDRPGVLTWVVPREGTSVRRGDPLARVADLSAFRVEATVSDIHAARIAPGLVAIVRSGDDRLEGRVTGVRPTVENGILTLEVALDDKSNPVLRPNLRVDVFLVTTREEDSLRLRRGDYLTVDGSPAVFVIRGDTAVRTPVRFGISSIDYYQILEGLAEGDEVIVSDMSDKMHVKEVKLK